MVNFDDPGTIANQFGAYSFPSGFRGQQPDLLVGHLEGVVKLWHLTDGVFM
jgi:hypothetical protein